MRPLGLEPDDRAFALARDGVALESSPSAVSDGTAQAPTGSDAWASVRRLPTTTSTRHLGSVLHDAQPSPRSLALAAAEFARRLAAHPLRAAERIWIAAPARADAHGLGTLLAIARHMSLPVDGFVDAAVAASTGLRLESAALVIELGLHHLAVTLTEREGGPTCRRRSLLSERGGYLELCQGWLDFINTAMVRQTRFDALRDGATEQQLFDALPALAREASSGGVATAAVSSAGKRFEVQVTRDQLSHAAQPLWRELARLLHELRPAGSAVALVLPQPLGELPGLRDTLAQFPGCELVLVPEGFAAAATSCLDLPPRGADEPVRLLRRLPADAAAGFEARALREAAAPRGPALAPSHVLYQGRTIALGSEPLVIGRTPGAAHAITLPEGLAGVSRRHCTLVRDGAQLVVLDHSRFGTFVNGERVAERAPVYAGDEVRIGDPGVTLALIAVGAAPPAVVSG